MQKKLFLKILTLGLIIAVGAASVGIYVWRKGSVQNVLEIYIFNLKNGHSVFIRTTDDRRILIGGGSNSEIVRHITKILPFYSRRIDEVFATDTDGKNVSGLIDVLERYSVRRVTVPSVTPASLGSAGSTDKIYETFIETAKRKNILLREIALNDRLDLGGGVAAEVLFPAMPDSFQYSRASSPKIVLRIFYGTNSVFYLGDITPKAQRFIALAGVRKSDVLIMSNSASPDSVSSELVNEIKPKYLVYSKTVSKSSARTVGGKNQKTDPLFFVLNDRRFNVKEGTVKIVSDGTKLEIR